MKKWINFDRNEITNITIGCIGLSFNRKVQNGIIVFEDKTYTTASDLFKECWVFNSNIISIIPKWNDLDWDIENVGGAKLIKNTSQIDIKNRRNYIIKKKFNLPLYLFQDNIFTLIELLKREPIGDNILKYNKRTFSDIERNIAPGYLCWMGR